MYIAQGIHWLQNNLSNVTQEMYPDKYLSPRFSDGDISNASVRPSVRPSRYLINTGRNLTKLRTWLPHVVRVCESNISTESGNFATACHRLRGLVFFIFFLFFFLIFQTTTTVEIFVVCWETLSWNKRFKEPPQKLFTWRNKTNSKYFLKQ